MIIIYLEARQNLFIIARRKVSQEANGLDRNRLGQVFKKEVTRTNDFNPTSDLS